MLLAKYSLNLASFLKLYTNFPSTSSCASQQPSAIIFATIIDILCIKSGAVAVKNSVSLPQFLIFNQFTLR
jgi:hypothetical protein